MQLQPFGVVIDDSLWPSFKVVLRKEVVPGALERLRVLEYLRAQDIISALSPLHQRFLVQLACEHPCKLSCTWPTLYEFYKLDSVQAWICDNGKAVDVESKMEAAKELGGTDINVTRLMPIRLEMLQAQQKIELAILKLFPPDDLLKYSAPTFLQSPRAWVTAEGIVGTVSNILESSRINYEPSVYLIHSALAAFAPRIAEKIPENPSGLYVKIPRIRDPHSIKLNKKLYQIAKRLLELVQAAGRPVPSLLTDAANRSMVLKCREPTSGPLRRRRHYHPHGELFFFKGAVSKARITVKRGLT